MDRRESELIEAFYDAALGHRTWEETGQLLRGHLRGKTLMLSTHDAAHSSADIILTQGLTTRMMQEYAHFAPHDVWALGALNRRLLDQALTSEEVVDDRVLLQSYIYNEYLRPHVDARYIVGAILPMRGGHHAVIGIHRPHDARDFTTEEAHVLNRLLPHVRRALEIRQRVRDVGHKADAAQFVLDRLSVGVILMSAAGRLLHVNAAGEAILKNGDGLQRAADGLRAGNRDDDKRLQELISTLRPASMPASSAGGHLRIRRPSGLRAYAVMVTPVGPSLNGSGKPAILAFVSDPEREAAGDPSVLIALFGLTPAEARLVLALMSGSPLADFARATGVTYNTVKTLLARAMAKTETHSQVELVLLVARSIGGLAPRPWANETGRFPG